MRNPWGCVGTHLSVVSSGMRVRWVGEVGLENGVGSKSLAKEDREIAITGVYVSVSTAIRPHPVQHHPLLTCRADTVLRFLFS